MIVEDDFSVRERLKSIIDWEALDIRLVAEAKDGATAQEYYEIYHPHLIITDINIPILSGLDLIAELQKTDPNLSFIVITGYNDFALAQRAANLHTASLLQKPILAADINSSIADTISRLEKEQSQKMSYSVLQQLVNDNLSQVQETYMSNLLREKAASPDTVHQKLSQLQISCSGSRYIVILLSFPSTSANTTDREGVILFLQSRLQQDFQNHGCSFFSFTDTHMRLNCIIGTTVDFSDNVIENILQTNLYQLGMKQQESYAGVGPAVSDPSALNISYQGALSALNYRGLLGDSHITHYKNLERTDFIIHSDKNIYAALLEKFRSGDIHAIEDMVERHISVLHAKHLNNSESVIRSFYFEYISHILKEVIRLGLNNESITNCATSIMKIFSAPDLEACREETLSVSAYLIDKIFAEKKEKSNHLIFMAQEYIAKHLSKTDLDLEEVSNYIGLSKNYFCKLFHEVEGTSFSNYLRKMRIQEAKRMLTSTNMKIYEISAAVGFSNAKYFSYAFKQQTAMTPIDYQNSHHISSQQ